MRVGILCDGTSGPVNLVSVMDRSMLVSVAAQAIKEAEARALSERDGRLSLVRQLELERLRATLCGLIPELSRDANIH